MTTIKYYSPRIAIAKISTSTDIQTYSKQIQSRHKQYYHLFNLTQNKLPSNKESSFKWRGIPYSPTELIKILTQIDTFLRINIANAAIICVCNQNMDDYAKMIIKTYTYFCLSNPKPASETANLQSIANLGNSIIKSHPYFFSQITKIYKNISVNNPPVKILQSFTIKPETLFIPIIQIFTQTRYNEFQSVYHHQIEEDLANYYLNLNQPLQTGIGQRYYDEKPQTKYFSKPVVVVGDVKIVVYSYKTLKKVYQFTVGFNTLKVDQISKENSGKLIQQNQDLYDRSGISKDQKITIQLNFSQFCHGKNCLINANCTQCTQHLKKISNRYSQAQLDLQKLHRKRTLPEIKTLFSL